MKKLIITLALALTANFAAQAQVYSNIVGMYKVPKIAGGLQLLGVSIGDDTTLSELIDIDQFTGDVLTIEADKIIAFNAATQTYVTYAKYDDTAYAGDTVSWRLFSDFYGADVDPVLPAGSAVWVQAVAGADVDLVVSGDVPVTENNTIEVVAGLQMLSLPYTAKVDLNSAEVGFITSGATGAILTIDADQIIKWDAGTQAFVTYALYDDTAYGGATVEWRLFSDFYNPPAEPIELDVGAGFWYRAENAFTWVATNPYFENL